MKGIEEFALTGKVALIMGGSGGIGAMMAAGFRAAGATVLLAARDEAKLATAAAALDQPGKTTFSVDVTDVAALHALADKVEATHGVPDILVNSQGALMIKPALELTEADYDHIMDVNQKSVFFTCTAFGARMVARGSGSIINISSLAAHTGWKLAAAYSVSKWGVTGLTQTLAAEWGPAGVRVNAIAPGFFLTDINRDKMPPERKAEAAKRSAMGRTRRARGTGGGGDLPGVGRVALRLRIHGAGGRRLSRLGHLSPRRGWGRGLARPRRRRALQ